MRKYRKRMCTFEELIAWIESKSKWDGQCFIYQGHRHNTGYGQVRWRCQPHLVHRLLLQDMYGEPKPGQIARHLCGRGHMGCVTREHLAWGTYSENEQDKRKHGTYYLRGVRARGGSKSTPKTEPRSM